MAYEKKRFYKVTIRNLSTVNREYFFKREVTKYTGIEEFFLPVFDDMYIKETVDVYLNDVCYCDGYEFVKSRKVSDKLNEKLNDVLYELFENADYFKAYGEEFTESDNCEIYYRLNAIAYTFLR